MAPDFDSVYLEVPPLSVTALSRMKPFGTQPKRLSVRQQADTAEGEQLPFLPELSEGVEVLLELAQSGKIDPWNVDLLQLTDAYLNHVETLALELSEGGSASPNETQHSLQLRLTGKTLLYLAILLRMKSDLLAGLDPFAEEEGAYGIEDASFEELIEFDEDGNPILRAVEGSASEAAIHAFRQTLKRRYGSLEDVLIRRTSTKQPRIRPVTLNDLIRELHRFEALEKERLAHQKLKVVEERRHRARDVSQLTTEAISSLAHDEFQEEQVQEVLGFIETLLEKENPEATLSLERLVEASGISTMVCFLSLLFLEARSLIVVEQSHFYSPELWIRWDSGNDTTEERPES
jgi:segregation and condensation protein A